MRNGSDSQGRRSRSNERSQINEIRRTRISSPYEAHEHYPVPPDREVKRSAEGTSNEPTPFSQAGSDVPVEIPHRLESTDVSWENSCLKAEFLEIGPFSGQITCESESEWIVVAGDHPPDGGCLIQLTSTDFGDLVTFRAD